MKKYVLIASDKYPKHHRLAGEETNFVNKMISGSKKHTCRMNYDFWKQRVDEVTAKRAFISVRSWRGIPYKSKQDEYIRNTSVGIEHLEIRNQRIFVNGYELTAAERIKLVANDGFENSEQGLADYLQWLKADKKDIHNACILHFTDLRYDKEVRKG